MVTQIGAQEIRRFNITEAIRKSLRFARENKTLTFGVIILTIMILTAIFADFIATHHYSEYNPKDQYKPPSPEYLFGTNLLGRDMFSRVVYGARIALLMAFTATILALIVGVPLGILSGYFGGKVDRVLTLIADAIYSFPALLLAITLAIYLQTFGMLKDIGPVAFATAIVYIPTYFRVVRAQVQRVKEEADIDAARAMGAGRFTTILRYVTPNVIASSIAIIPFNMTDAILTNAALAFLGLGIEPPTPDWGYDVYDARSLARIRLYPWLIFFPALMIFLLAFSLSLIGDALNDRYNPVLKKAV
ncbi:MAG: ABC transporter permease [Candidatus Hodarchaeota archaeon]